MKILGINISHDFSICVYDNKKIVDLFYEERFIFNKYWEPLSNNKKDLFLLSIFKKINFMPDLVIYSSYGRASGEIEDDNIILQIQKQLNNPPYYFDKKKHHIYHACSAFNYSGFSEAMAIVVDGGGAMPRDVTYQEMQSIFYIDKKNIFKLFQHLSNLRFIKNWCKLTKERSNLLHIEFENGVEYLFSSLCTGGQDFIKGCWETNMDDEDAGKLMGLASYAYTDKKYDLNYNYVKIAKEVQEKSFNETCQLIEKAFKYKQIKNFVLSGGYFLNCSNNFKYIKKYPDFNFFVDPIPHDGGTAIGACIYYDNYR